MWTSISPLQGERKEIVKEYLTKHPEWYDGYDDLTVMHAHFYQVLGQADEFIAFFALCYWECEVVLACVYVFEQYRKHGVFNEIAKFAKRKTPLHHWCTINAMRGNKLANEIYNKKFKFHHVDEEEDCNWYVIKSAR